MTDKFDAVDEAIRQLRNEYYSVTNSKGLYEHNTRYLKLMLEEQREVAQGYLDKLRMISKIVEEATGKQSLDVVNGVEVLAKALLEAQEGAHKPYLPYKVLDCLENVWTKTSTGSYMCHGYVREYQALKDEFGPIREIGPEL